MLLASMLVDAEGPFAPPCPAPHSGAIFVLRANSRSGTISSHAYRSREDKMVGLPSITTSEE